MIWTDYFTLVGVVPGRIVVCGHGTLDFSDGSLPVEKIRMLFEGGFPYLKVTPLGEDTFYQKPALTVDQTGDIPQGDVPPAKKPAKKKM